jgi:hypothetical protein
MLHENVEWDKLIFEQAYQFLLKEDNVTKELIDKHLVPEEKNIKPNTLNQIYKSILISAENVQMSPNVIGKSISGKKGNIKPLKTLLFNFNPHKTFEEYKGYSPEELFEIIKPKLIKIPEKVILWERYCKTIISAATFLNQFKNHQKFYEFIDAYNDDNKMRPFLPMYLSFEIDGLGYALSCDFLKEMGYINFGKPGTHIKDIFIELRFLTNISKNSLKADYFSFKLIERIAKNNKTTPYAVDKLIWLICSGNFYLAEIEIGSKKKEFIKFMKQNFNQYIT